MKTLLSFLFYQKITKSSTKKFKKNFKKKNASSLIILTNLGTIIYLVIEFIFKTISSIISPKKIIVEPKNVVNFNKYKIEKLQKKSNVIQFPKKVSKI
ncbi:MAG TPA: hypothetical protein VIM70_10615 [Clostridium sp.]|uniref:hypothetical protein n=1 Tax=Clostridium sp. TaxID=1506 RepID=UPI002F91F740